MALKNLGQRVRSAREAKGWTQAELARAVGISQPSVMAIEDGKTKKTKHISAFARALGKTVEWLEDGSGDGDAHKVLINELPNLIGSVKLRRVEVVGVASVGSWVASHETISKLDRAIVYIPRHPVLDRIDVVGLEVGDGHADRRMSPGMVAICATFADLKREPRPGELVVVSEQRDDGKRQITLREFHADRDGARVATPTSKPELLLSSILGPRVNTNDKASIIFCVVGEVRLYESALH